MESTEKHRQPEPWIFILKEGLLPGQFYLSLFRPMTRELPKIVVEKIYETFTFVLGWYERLVDERLIHRRVNSLAHLMAEEYTRLFSVAASRHMPVWVIPHGEFQDRTERGEFSVRVATKKERLEEGWALHKALMGHYRRHEATGGAFSWRLQSAVISDSNKKHLKTVCAGGASRRSFTLFWCWPSKPEIECHTRRLTKLKTERRDFTRVRSNPQERGEVEELVDINKIYTAAPVHAAAA